MTALPFVRRFVAAVLLILSAVPGYCQTLVDSTSTAPWATSPASSLGRMLIVLVLIVFLIWITLYILRRAMGMKGRSMGGMEMLGGMSLGQRKSLQFVRVGKSVYLLGATDHHVGLITTIDDPEEVEQILSGTSSAVSEPFSALFRKLTRGAGRGSVRSGESTGN